MLSQDVIDLGIATHFEPGDVVRTYLSRGGWVAGVLIDVNKRGVAYIQLLEGPVVKAPVEKLRKRRYILRPNEVI